MINSQAKNNIEIESSDNGGFIIKVTGSDPVHSALQFPRGAIQRQSLLTAMTIDEVMIIVREQVEAFIK